MIGRASESVQSACEATKSAIAEHHLFLGDNIPAEMGCSIYQETGTHIVLMVRYARTKTEGEGSNLVGYFAVRKSDFRVFKWDFANESVLGHGYQSDQTKVK